MRNIALNLHDDDEMLLELGLTALVEDVLAEMAEDGEMARDQDGRWHRTEKGWQKVATEAGLSGLGQHDTWESLCRRNGLGIILPELDG